MKLRSTGRELGVLRHGPPRCAFLTPDGPFSAAPTPIFPAPSPAKPTSGHLGGTIACQGSCLSANPQTATTIENP
jgi:hypothetical protein